MHFNLAVCRVPRIIRTHALLTVVLLLAGCGSTTAPGSEGASLIRGADGLKLQILESSFLPGSSAQLRLETWRSGEFLVCDIQATEAQSLKALYYKLSFDGSRYEANAVRPGLEFEQQGKSIYLGVETSPGELSGGQVLVNPQRHSGFSGHGRIAQIILKQRAERLPSAGVAYPRVVEQSPKSDRHISAAPDKDASAPLLFINPQTKTLSWNYANQGDYDQNSEVNISDLTPIAIHFGEVAAGGFDPATALSAIDGDSNGEINIADITPIGQNFGRRVSGYAIFESGSEVDAPAANDDPSKIASLATVDFSEAQGAAQSDRLSFSFVLDAVNLLDFYWVRSQDISDSTEGTPSNLVIGEGTNLNAPTAAIQAAPLFGEAPLEVSFSGLGSTDANGSIALFEWDFEGDGTFELNSGSLGEANHSYFQNGNFNATLKVTDDEGNTDTDQVTISVGVNAPPVAALTGTPNQGPAPLTVDFDSSGSNDPDGIIAARRWDFDNDGTFEIVAGNIVVPSHDYLTAGVFECLLEVEDDAGTTDTETFTISVSPPNELPTAVLNADTTSGDAPLTVTFDAIGSSDSDGSINLYEYDFDGDGLTDDTQGSTAAVQHTYTEAGSFDAKLTVTDTDGGTSEAVKSIEVTLAGNQNPTAVLNADVSSGTRPLTVGFNAGASSDPDGTIASFAWDFDNDGIFELDPGTAAESFTYTGKTGTSYTALVRVTDDDGATATDTFEVSITGSWHIVTARSDPNFIYQAPSLAVISGRPAICVSKLTADFLESDLVYCRAGNSDGTTFWGPEVPVSNTPAFMEGFYSSMAEVNGFPAIAYGVVGNTRYIQADSTDGSSWANAFVTMSETANILSMAVVSGRPAIAYQETANLDLKYLRADDADGAAWTGTPFPIATNGNIGGGPSLAIIGGRPAISCRDEAGNGCVFVRAKDDTGSDWNSVVTASLGNFTGTTSALCSINDNPAMVLSFTGAPGFVRALDPNGDAWGESVTLQQTNQQGLGLVELGNRPFACWFDQTAGELNCSMGKDIDGNVWEEPENIDAPNTGTACSMTLVNGHPAIAYQNAIDGAIKYAIYF